MGHRFTEDSDALSTRTPSVPLAAGVVMAVMAATFAVPTSASATGGSKSVPIYRIQDLSVRADTVLPSS